jgi:hypothetical protein
MKCPNCGAAADPESTFCEMCGHALTGAPTAVVVDEPLGTQYSSNGSMTVIAGTPIVLGDGESVWREYAVTQLRRRAQGEGKLFVTDSRVIFFAIARGRATTRSSSLIQETKLDQVTGLSAYVSRKISMLWLVATMILGLGALLLLARGSTSVGILLLVLTVAAVFLLVRGAARRGMVGVAINAGAQASPINFGFVDDNASRSRFFIKLMRSFVGPLLGLVGGNTAIDVVVGIPGADAERVIAELGALIIDLQSKGSHAAERWEVTLAASA